MSPCTFHTEHKREERWRELNKMMITICQERNYIKLRLLFYVANSKLIFLYISLHTPGVIFNNKDAKKHDKKWVEAHDESVSIIKLAPENWYHFFKVLMGCENWRNFTVIAHSLSLHNFSFIFIYIYGFWELWELGGNFSKNSLLF